MQRGRLPSLPFVVRGVDYPERISPALPHLKVMSNFSRLTKNPDTGEFEIALWLDDYFGPHEYGVLFQSTGKVVAERSLPFDSCAPAYEGNPEEQ